MGCLRDRVAKGRRVVLKRKVIQTMSEQTTASPPSERLFTLLCKKMQSAPQVAQRVNAHIRAISGHNSVVNYHNNGCTEQERSDTYALLLNAALRNDWTKLEGQIAVGQVTTPVPEAEDPDPLGIKPEVPAVPIPLVKQAEKPASIPSTMARAPETPDDAVTRALQVLGRYMGPKTAEVDEAKVIEIVKAAMDGQKSLFHGDLTKEFGERFEVFEKLVEDQIQDCLLKKLPARDVLEIRAPDGVREIAGATHWQLPQIATWIQADVPLWLWGQAGGGKTTLGRQIAEALGLEPYIISIDPTMTVGKMLGFRNLSTGEYVEGFLYRPFKNGGLVKMDEIDTGDPGIIASLNALVSNEFYLFPNGVTIQKHKDFRIIAGANTKGTGAVAGYTARNRLDAATLDRFAVIELTYDEDLERSLALGVPKVQSKHWKPVSVEAGAACTERWVDYVQKVRKTVGSSVLVSPRASILGCRALRAGIPPAEVAEALLYKLMTADTRENVTSQCGRFQ